MEKGVVVLVLAIVVPGVWSVCDVGSLNNMLEDLVELSLLTGMGSLPNITVSGSQIVCLSTAETRGTYKSASVVVNCTGSACPGGGGLLQFDFMCENMDWRHSTSDDIMDLEGADLTTSLRINCGRCERLSSDSTVFDRYDNVTHCIACTSNCNTGLMECTNTDEASCCNGVVNNTCVANCTAPARPLASANFTCTVFCDPLAALLNGTITLTNGDLEGSVATHECDMNYELQGAANRTCEVSGDMAVWSGSAPTCMAVTTTMAMTDTMAPMTDTMAPMTDTMAPMMDTMAPMTTMDIGGTTTQAPLICEDLTADSKQVISYSNNCTNEIDCQAVYSCEDGYELMGGATVRTCSLPSDRVPVWSGIAPQCQLQSTSLTQPELAGIGIAVAVVGAAVLVGIVVIVILVLSRR